MRKFVIFAATALSLVIGAAVTAQAMPASGFVTPAVSSGDDASLILVAGGCGPGFHRGPYGGCRPNRYFGPRPGFGPRCVLRRGPYGGVRRVCFR